MSASQIVQQRCVIHFQREAAARCPSCNRFFCRECVTEHDDRLICAACLAKQVKGAVAEKRSFKPVLRFFHLVLAVFVLWLFFYYAGRALLAIPESFHEGAIWGEGN